MNIITYIYKDFADDRSSSYEFRRSVDHFGYNLINVSTTTRKINFARVLKAVYLAFKALPPDAPAMYADGADTFFLRPIECPTDHILYMAERNVWPQTDEMYNLYRDNPGQQTPWQYLNGGAYMGPAGLICEYFKKTGLHELAPLADHESQAQQTIAYFKALNDGFPVLLDELCVELQTTGFCDPPESTFELLTNAHYADGGIPVLNKMTASKPALFHGNGRTDIHWLYSLLPKERPQDALITA